MNRSEGLVRRIRTRENADGVPLPAEPKNDETNDNAHGTEDPDADDSDAKETRLTLMEEVLLLGLKDKEVHTNCFILNNFMWFMFEYIADIVNV